MCLVIKLKVLENIASYNSGLIGQDRPVGRTNCFIIMCASIAQKCCFVQNLPDLVFISFILSRISFERNTNISLFERNIREQKKKKDERKKQQSSVCIVLNMPKVNKVHYRFHFAQSGTSIRLGGATNKTVFCLYFHRNAERAVYLRRILTGVCKRSLLIKASSNDV